VRIFVVAACLMFAALAVPTSAAAQAAGAPQFVCNQVTGLTLTREWYQAGFDHAPGIADDRWQLKARQSGYITEWSNPWLDFPAGTTNLPVHSAEGCDARREAHFYAFDGLTNA
jgi:hypothetical protein